jgi:drug/metabolite transporter (DMT)-like permease
MKLPRKSVLVGLAALLLSALIAVATLMRQSSPFTWSPWVLWVCAPYAALAAALLVPWGDPDRRARTGCISALVLLAVSHFFYRGISGSGDAQAGLLFYFLPMYLFPAGALLWALLYWLGPRIWTWLSAETGKLD